MESFTERQPLGSLQISRDVIATIAGTAALEISGVESLVPCSKGLKRLGFKRIAAKPVNIAMSDGIVEIDIGVSLMVGAKIGEVGPAVQNAVKNNVQNMTGMVVSKVNVFVARIVFEREAAPRD